jgi:hypothetical protein
MKNGVFTDKEAWILAGAHGAHLAQIGYHVFECQAHTMDYLPTASRAMYSSMQPNI